MMMFNDDDDTYLTKNLSTNWCLFNDEMKKIKIEKNQFCYLFFGKRNRGKKHYSFFR